MEFARGDVIGFCKVATLNFFVDVIAFSVVYHKLGRTPTGVEGLRFAGSIFSVIQALLQIFIAVKHRMAKEAAGLAVLGFACLTSLFLSVGNIYCISKLEDKYIQLKAYSSIQDLIKLYYAINLILQLAATGHFAFFIYKARKNSGYLSV